MKATKAFEQALEKYIRQQALFNCQLAKKFYGKGKNITDCATYIINQVQKSGVNGFTDDEIYGMAVHYYEEDDIEVGKPTNCKIIVNHQVELTEEEKAEERQKAKEKYYSDEITRLKEANKKRRSAKTTTVEEETDLFSYN